VKQVSTIAGVLLFAAAPLSAQVHPISGDGDPHLQLIDYNPGQIVQLRGAPGYELMVELSPDEQVQSVALGDSGSWQVSVSKSGDRLFLKPSQSGSGTNMTVVTSVRVYNFDLVADSGPSPDMPYNVQFRYPAPRAVPRDAQYVDVSAAARRASRYRINGDRLLRPTSVTDDGQHTYIVWPKDAPIPAVYTVDRSGNEVLVNGMMGTNDVYVVDGAPQLLTFRIDHSMAYAERLSPRKGH
jgi:type IV secretion system protein VirB9